MDQPTNRYRFYLDHLGDCHCNLESDHNGNLVDINELAHCDKCKDTGQFEGPLQSESSGYGGVTMHWRDKIDCECKQNPDSLYNLIQYTKGNKNG